MSARSSSRNSIAAVLAAPLFGAALAASGGAQAACTGPGAPSNTETKCLTAVQIPGAALRSYDISWVNPHRAEYYLADRSNAAIDIIDTRHVTFKRFLGKGQFVGIKLNGAGTAVNNDISGPDGVVTHGRWLYAGDGDSTLKVFDLDSPDASALKATVSTGGEARVDEMALTTDGELLLVANNADTPPFGTLFAANGDRNFNSVNDGSRISKITIDPVAFPDTPGIEQPTWDPKTKRFYVSVPILGKPGGCGTATCDGGLMVIDPNLVTPGSYVLPAFDASKNHGVLALSNCGPNGITVGPNDNLLLGCTPANNPANDSTLVINATTKHFSHVNNIVGSDEVWFNSGDGRYYTGSNRNCTTSAPCPAASQQTAVLGVIDGTSVLIETVPQSSGSHSVAADSKRNLIFVPQSAPVATVGNGGDTTGPTHDGLGGTGAGICGSNNGCIGVYSHQVDKDKDDHDHDRDDHDHDH